MRLPHANARVTKVAGQGAAEDYDRPAGPGVTFWEGECDAFVKDTRRLEYSDGKADLVTVRTVVVPAELAVEVSNFITLRWRGITKDWPVRSMLRAEAPPGVPGTTTIEIEPT